MFTNTLLLALLSALATTTAIPLAGTDNAPSFHHTPRSLPSTKIDSSGRTIYAPNWATCANDASITSVFPGGSTVTISDCDAAIEAICVAADNMYKSQVAGDHKIPLQSMSKTVNTCEAHISFTQTTLADPLTHDSCVSSFQQISVECMVIGPGKYAAPGKQAGLMNMIYNPSATGGACSNDPPLKSSNAYNLYPGYAVAQSGYFGDICGVDPSTVSSNP